MMRNLYLIIIFIGQIVNLIGQNTTIELTFTARDYLQHIYFDSIYVRNTTQGGDTTLYGLDTILVIDYATIIKDLDNTQKNRFSIINKYPNPIIDQASIEIYIPESSDFSCHIYNLAGQEITFYKGFLDSGKHLFKFQPGRMKFYLFIARWNNIVRSTKLLNSHEGIKSERCKLLYLGQIEKITNHKEQSIDNDFIFSLGDTLLIVGYSSLGESGILKVPLSSQIYELQFATNTHCINLPTVYYEGQIYNTIQIYSQCWLKENLNVGLMIDGSLNQTNDSIIEKYCYNNDSMKCQVYGGLYQWDETMQYSDERLRKDICPDGWHVPTDEEWKILEGMVDSNYGVGDQIWDNFWWHGSDVGTMLKSTSGWYWGGNGTDSFGFTLKPAGYRALDGSFKFMEHTTNQWTSTTYSEDTSIDHQMDWLWEGVMRYNENKNYGFSLRCIKD